MPYANRDHKKLLYAYLYSARLTFFQRLRLRFYNWLKGVKV